MNVTPAVRRAILLGIACSLLGQAVMAGAADQAVVRIWNWAIADKKYQDKMYKLFNKDHPDIKIEFSSISNTVYAQTLEAAFVAQEPPDLFWPAGKIDLDYLRSKGLAKPLNECAPSKVELEQWMARYPARPSKFVEGASVFDGKVYIVDISPAMGLNEVMPLYYNKTLFAEAGIDKPPATQSELRRIAAKATEAGQGKYFGIVHGLRYRPGAWNQDISLSLAWAAGLPGGHAGLGGLPDLRDGKFHHGSAEFVAALNTWVGMRTDGSVYPGETSIEDEQAKMAFATNRAALFFGGSWVVSNVLAYNPDADFDLVLPPAPDSGVRKGYGYVYSRGAPSGYLVSSYTKHPAAVWEVIKFITSLEYQAGYVQGGYGVSFSMDANKPENFRMPQLYKFVQWGAELNRLAPILSESARKAWTYLPGIYPTFEDVMDNVYLGKAGPEALVDLDRRCDAALDEAIKKAQADGVKVSRQDFVFPDWDPSKDYLR